MAGRQAHSRVNGKYPHQQRYAERRAIGLHGYGNHSEASDVELGQYPQIGNNCGRTSRSHQTVVSVIGPSM